MKKAIFNLLVLVMCFSICACSITEDSQNPVDGTGSAISQSQKLSESEAIRAAKNSSSVNNAIASKFDLQYYSIDWGYASAYYVDLEDVDTEFESYWVVTLYGNVSGYTDYYKTDYVIAEPFECEVDVSNDGDTSYPSVSRG